jgi:hypothetical protein
LIICLFATLQGCCTLLGHAIGKSIDEKSNNEVSYTITDSLSTASDSSAVAIKDSSKSNYRTLFAILGAATDISLVVIGVMATSHTGMNFKL